MNSGRMPAGKVWGFAMGTLGEYFVYYLFYTYFLYYLTDYVLIPASVAGTIMTVAMLWDAFTDPVVGYINDISKNPKGRRRPMMFAVFIPFAIAFALCFIRPGLDGTALYLYYGIVCLAFWLCFTMEQVPFYGLLPEITNDDQDRMRLRAAMGFIGNAGNLAVSIVPITLSAVIAMGVNEMMAWSVVMGILGAIGTLGFVVCWHTTRGMETPPDKVIRPEGNIFKTYGKILTLKGYIPVVVIYILCTIDLCVMFNSILYVADSKLALPALMQSIIVACYTFSGALFVVLVTPMNKKWGSYKSIQIVMIAATVLFAVFGLIGLNSAVILILHGLLTGGTFALATAFTYGLLYQIIDVAFLKSNEQLEGSVISFATLGYKIGAAAAASITAGFLTIVGYDPAAESKAEVLGHIDYMLTMLPAALLLISILVLKFAYPLREDLYKKILIEKNKKLAGETFSVEEIKHLF